MKNRNELLANYMGFEKVKINHFGTIYETKWQLENEDWLNKVGLTNVGEYFVNLKEDLFFETDNETVKYHSSWDWLLPVWHKASCQFFDSEFREIKAKICMAICDVNIDNAYKYLSSLISVAKMKGLWSV